MIAIMSTKLTKGYNHRKNLLDRLIVPLRDKTRESHSASPTQRVTSNSMNFCCTILDATFSLVH